MTQGWSSLSKNNEQTSLHSRIGLRAMMALRSKFGVIAPQMSFDWKHEYENDQRDIQVSFVGDSRAKRFTYQTEAPDRDWGEINARVALLLPSGFQVFGNYRRLVGHEFFDGHAISIGMRVQL